MKEFQVTLNMWRIIGSHIKRFADKQQIIHRSNQQLLRGSWSLCPPESSAPRRDYCLQIVITRQFFMSYLYFILCTLYEIV